MSKLTAEQVAAIRAREQAATPGPWAHRIDRSWQKPDRIIDSTVMVVIRDENCEAHWKEGRDEANFDFIAHARTDVPALCDTVDALRAELDTAEARLNEAHALLMRSNVACAQAEAEAKRYREALETIAKPEDYWTRELHVLPLSAGEMNRMAHEALAPEQEAK